MFPGMNPRKMNQMMKRMGIAQTEIPATEVIIKQNDKEIVIANPQVSLVKMMGQDTYQIVGSAEERAISSTPESSTPEINEDDIKTVMEQTGAEEDKVKQVLEETKGDLAEAIIKLKGE
ncbi:MAG: nascent polypeptide-associated complex protein [Candidatus Woesearchaeota archaeon]|jgi:nascent polypeptide-associated complex subunit alpha|nr:nascent polypeptide-associated complex protein [Candidatus Woesearchaeota archaeon]MDP7506517.1 nascent polypeptide-associated complex protein [Candidatus Woesearchaeota archaeon]MDP7610655.1 nascent polypeptide-associated complex protein [Candidatus Woesearchaeota archaeon]|tara:strand:+ start:962 stop:1318 length:357 start_codon:yes stop_codon:yes gene_type:complete